MGFPPLTICLYTHLRHADRLAYAKTTAAAIIAKCLNHYSGEQRFHVADDDSDPDALDQLLEFIRKCGHEPTLTRAGGMGYGASHNAATQAIHGDNSDLVLPLEDDWELLRELPIDRLSAYFETDFVDAVRLGYLGWTDDLTGRMVRTNGGDACLLFDWDCTEPHVSAGHPRIETVEYQRRVGFWRENVDPGWAEIGWCWTRRARQGVVWPMDIGISASQGRDGSFFHHIGTTQARQDQEPAV